MNEFCIGVVVGIALAAAALWVAMRIIARDVNRWIARAGRSEYGDEAAE